MNTDPRVEAARTHDRLVLDTLAWLVAPGEPVSPMVLAEVLGWHRERVAMALYRLRMDGLCHCRITSMGPGNATTRAVVARQRARIETHRKGSRREG